jgi:transcriptional regulator with XRE-family HTH domain
MAPRTRGIGKSVHSPEQLAFCELLTAARRKAGLTQQQVAGRLRKPQSFVAKYETGERRVDVIEFVAIARILGSDAAGMLRTLIRRIQKPAAPARHHALGNNPKAPK